MSGNQAATAWLGAKASVGDRPQPRTLCGASWVPSGPCTVTTQVPSVPCFCKENKTMALPSVMALGKRLVSPSQHLQEPGVVTAAPRLSGLRLC